MGINNRRKNKRLRIDRAVKIPVQIFPHIPFIGKSIEVGLLNISGGGMALIVDVEGQAKLLKRGASIRVHFNIPGLGLHHCKGKISHLIRPDKSRCFLGINFLNPPAKLIKLLNHMAEDNFSCDQRIQEQRQPWCDINCSYHFLCRKPIRILSEKMGQKPLEIALQFYDEAAAA